MLVFLNLIVLSIIKLVGADSFELTFSLVGMVFAIMVVVIFYQFYFIILCCQDGIVAETCFISAFES